MYAWGDLINCEDIGICENCHKNSKFCNILCGFKYFKHNIVQGQLMD